MCIYTNIDRSIYFYKYCYVSIYMHISFYIYILIDTQTTLTCTQTWKHLIHKWTKIRAQKHKKSSKNMHKTQLHTKI